MSAPGDDTILPLFATPFGVLKLPQAAGLNAACATILLERAATVGRAADSSDHTPMQIHRWDDPCLDAAPLKTVVDEAARGVRSVVAALNRFTPAQFESLTMQTRSGFGIVRTHGAMPARSFSMTSWIGIYCIAAPEASDRAESGALRLYEARLGNMFSDATNSALSVPYASGHYNWRPVPGRLAVFPGVTQHEIAIVRSPGPLIFITVRARFVAPGQEGWSSW